jgi:hypothetical protein
MHIQSCFKLLTLQTFFADSRRCPENGCVHNCGGGKRCKEPKHIDHAKYGATNGQRSPMFEGSISITQHEENQRIEREVVLAAAQAAKAKIPGAPCPSCDALKLYGAYACSAIVCAHDESSYGICSSSHLASPRN